MPTTTLLTPDLTQRAYNNSSNTLPMSSPYDNWHYHHHHQSPARLYGHDGTNGASGEPDWFDDLPGSLPMPCLSAHPSTTSTMDGHQQLPPWQTVTTRPEPLLRHRGDMSSAFMTSGLVEPAHLPGPSEVDFTRIFSHTPREEEFEVFDFLPPSSSSPSTMGNQPMQVFV